jgi:hypothetical protein
VIRFGVHRAVLGSLPPCPQTRCIGDTTVTFAEVHRWGLGLSCCGADLLAPRELRLPREPFCLDRARSW